MVATMPVIATASSRPREETVGADPVNQRRHGDHGVGGVEIAADQKPGDPSAELPSAQPPFVKVLADRSGLPARGEKSHHGDKDKEEKENRESNPVDLIGHDDALSGIRLTEITEFGRARAAGTPARSAMN